MFGALQMRGWAGWRIYSQVEIDARRVPCGVLVELVNSR